MSKLLAGEKFLDLSDYGRPIAVSMVKRISDSGVTPVQLTLVFGLCGLISVYCILKGYYITAGIFFILKSIIDAMDGELARVIQKPSYTGRYLDSVFDIILNFLFIGAIWLVTDHSLWLAILAFFALQLQGTLYNYYYVIVRHNSAGGDKTSNVFETETPVAYPTENQRTVNILFLLYTVFYSVFDRIIYTLDRKASTVIHFPKWFMTLCSIYGLGFQLLIIAVLLAVGQIDIIIPFFVSYSVFILILISIRKLLLTERVGSESM